MIRKLEKDKWQDLVPILKENILENYFNILGLVNDEDVYKEIYIQYSKEEEIKSIIFIRNSLTIKFYARKEFTYHEVIKFLQTIEYKYLIGPKSYCNLLQDGFILNDSIKMTDLCTLNLIIDKESKFINRIEPLSVSNLDEVIKIYEKSFKSFASKNVLTKRLEDKRGSAYGIFKGEDLVSVAFTDFESDKEALIVGVATLAEYRNKGYGSELVKYLSINLQKRGKKVHLEYESKVAGNIYKRLGFTVVDSVYKYWN